MKTLKALLVLIVIFLAAGIGWLYAGGFDAAADSHHSKLVLWLINTARARSIEVHSKELTVPVLDGPERLAAGAHEYAEMCEGCHSAPAKPADDGFVKGLYPQPPDLTQHPHTHPAEMFWIIKHGIKMSAMPAWGLSHDDDTIWSIVAFVQKLPTLTLEQYTQMTADSAAAHAEAHAAEKPAAQTGGDAQDQKAQDQQN